MPVENANYLSNLDKTWPLAQDGVAEGDNHLRLLKAVLQSQFPGVNGNGFSKAILATEDEINRLQGITGNVQEIIDGLDFVPASTGGKFLAPVTVTDELIIDATADSDGLSIYEGTDFRGAFNFSALSKAIVIWQQGDGPQGSPDTQMSLDNGKVAMSSYNPNAGTLPTQDNHLATKEYVDLAISTGGGTFLPLTGGSLSGELEVRNRVTVKEHGGEPYVGLSVENSAGILKGAFAWDSSNNHMYIQDTGAGAENVPDTLVAITNGNVNVSSPNDVDTAPEHPNDLANKQYVDDVFAGETPGGYLPLAGGDMLGEMSVVGELDIKPLTADTDNYGIAMRNLAGDYTGAVYVEGASKELKIVQQGGGAQGSPDTILEIEQGKILLYSPRGYSTAPSNGLHLANKSYVDAKFNAAVVAAASVGATDSFVSQDGKTVTVVDGLITSII